MAGAAGHDPWMDRRHAAALEHDDLGRAQADADSSPDEVCRDGVLHHPHRDHRGPVNTGVEHQSGLEHLHGQRSKQWLLEREVVADGKDMPADAPALVSGLPPLDLLVEVVKGIDLGHRDQVVATEPADRAFDATLLVSALDAGLAVERVEPGA